MALREIPWTTLMRARSRVLRTVGAATPRESTGPRRLTFVQFGDYAEGFHRFARGEGATYYAQEYTVRHVGEIAARDDVDSVHVLTFAKDLPREVLPNGVVTSGVQLYPEGRRARHRALIDAVAATEPTHLIVAAPIVPLIRWGLKRALPVLPLFADSFAGDGFRIALRNRRLAYVLNHPGVELVANHNLASSLDLARIGVDERKIVPFDWPAIVKPTDWPAKEAPPSDRPLRLLYVGMLMETKGVGDAIEAVAELGRGGREAELTLIGKGDEAGYRALAEREGVAERVTFAGRMPHSEVLRSMHESDLVLVPSHHAYPEGLPMTLYEALCTRSPLVASDHPMFRLRIRDGYNAVVHRERDAKHLAQRIREVTDDGELYARLSRTADEAAEGYLCPLKWDVLVSGFLDPSERERMREYTLARHDYGR